MSYSVYDLARVLQSEASGHDAAALTAVANTIANRANQNFNGYGNDVFSQAFAQASSQTERRQTSL